MAPAREEQTRQASPYGSYAAIIGTFAGVLAATAALERDRSPRTPLDFVLLSAASFKAARAVSRERVGSVLREPFVETEPASTGEADEHPAGRGLQRAIGELVTCTRCVGTWSAAGGRPGFVNLPPPPPLSSGRRPPLAPCRGGACGSQDGWDREHGPRGGFLTSGRPARGVGKKSKKMRTRICLPAKPDLRFGCRASFGRPTARVTDIQAVLEKGKPIARWGRKAMGSYPSEGGRLRLPGYRRDGRDP